MTLTLAPATWCGPTGSSSRSAGRARSRRFGARSWACSTSSASKTGGGPAGYINPLLYSKPLDSIGALHDIVSGSNGAYDAGPGWDACTGLGSPDGAKLLSQIGGSAMGAEAGRRGVPTRTQTGAGTTPCQGRGLGSVFSHQEHRDRASRRTTPSTTTSGRSRVATGPWARASVCRRPRDRRPASRPITTPTQPRSTSTTTGA